LSAGVPNTPTPATQSISDEAHDVVRNFPLPLLGSQIETHDKSISLVIAPAAKAPLSTLKQMEDHLAAQLGGWTVHIVPPPRPLPPVLFARASADLGDEQIATMQLVVWAAQRWGVTQVLVEGRASTDGKGTASLASDRASHVRDWLEAAGLHVSMGTSYPLPDQARVEETDGIDLFRSVLIQVTDPAKTD
jgi:outer membrane protein OmpA-like peptidoglycan-associated protein